MTRRSRSCPTPVISVSLSELEETGFTPSGKRQFQDTLQDYGRELFDKSVRYGEMDKAPNSPCEITHDHVRASAYTMAKSFGLPVTPHWQIYAQVGEYLCAAIAGAGAGHLDKPLGILIFGISLTLGVVLFVLRSVRSQESL